MTHRNPPEHSRFKKGKSGNPRGRPRWKTKPDVSAGSLFRKVAREPICVEIDGAEIRIPRWEAYVRQIYTMALNRSNGASRLIERLRKHFPGDLLPGDSITFIINEEDTQL
jgi:hypothetical protein